MDNVQSGQTIGPYRIIQQIGQGGMAVVYKAYQPAMDRYVALKILPRHLADSPEFIGRFKQEARTIARLEHAHILPVHDYGESDGHMYLAMRFIEAGTLKDRLQAGPLTSAEIDRCFAQLADALDYAHAQGVVHRDLKPSNVLIDARGNLFLTDFGIAKLLEADSRFTGSGAMIGTPAYMSPEQAQGLRIDQRTDIYSLGIMLYEMVTGCLPFEAETPLAIILKVLNDPLPLPSSIKPDIAPAVEQVLLKALAKNRDDRFATAGQFSAAWQAARRPAHGASVTQFAAPLVLAAAPPSAPPELPAAVRSAPRPLGPVNGRRRVGGLALLAAGALLVLGLVVCGGLLALAAFNQRRGAQAQPTGAAAAVTAAATGSATGSATASAVIAKSGSAQGQWRSWTAANNVLAVALFNGKLVSAGPGGLTFWNLADGAVAGRLTTANGLPDSNVAALLADDQAHSLWIATAAGVLAFDGQRAKVYDQTSGLDSNVVAALARTRRGLLAGTLYSGVDGGGLNLLNNDRWQPVAGFPSAGQPDAAPDKLSSNVRAILEDSKGVWWVGTSNGLGRYDGQTWARYSTADGLPANSILSLLEADGTIWAGTDGGAAHLDGQAFVPFSQAQGRPVLGMFLAANGDLWLEGGGGALRRPAGGSQWQVYDNTKLPVSSVYGGVEAAGGTIFFGGDAGVLRYDGRVFDLWTVPNVPAQSTYGHILAGPTAGQIWFVQTSDINTDLFDLTRAAWTPGPSLPCDSCSPLAWGPDGRLWAGSDQGIWIVHGANATHLASEQGLPAGQALALAFARDGSTWIGTNTGLALYAGSPITTVYTAANAGLADDSVNRLLAAADGSLWVATDADLSRRLPDHQWLHYGPGNPFQNNVRVNGLAQDASGAIWVATDGEGVYRFDKDTWTQFRPSVGGVRLPSNQVLCVTAARDGSVWFGTQQAGAARFDGTSWQAFTVADGLVDSNVNDIYVDRSGVVWFATGGGVSAYQP
jgi:ligand-binding sensor domain-containing protein